MGKYIFEEFADYNKRANNKMNSIIKNLSEEEWDKTFSSYWNSIHNLCTHIYNADYGWLDRFKIFTNPKGFSNIDLEKNYNWKGIVFQNINDYIKMREELDEKIIVYVNEITEDDLEIIMSLTDREGNIHSKKLGIYFTHMFNHATHNRGQISVYLDILGKENDWGSF